jgi:hypothetical protein
MGNNYKYEEPIVYTKEEMQHKDLQLTKEREEVSSLILRIINKDNEIANLNTIVENVKQSQATSQALIDNPKELKLEKSYFSKFKFSTKQTKNNSATHKEDSKLLTTLESDQPDGIPRIAPITNNNNL